MDWFILSLLILAMIVILGVTYWILFKLVEKPNVSMDTYKRND